MSWLQRSFRHGSRRVRPRQSSVGSLISGPMAPGAHRNTDGCANCRRRRYERLSCNLRSRRLRDLLSFSLFFADGRFQGASSSDKPIKFSLLTHRYVVRLSGLAFLATGSLRVMGFKARTSPFDRGLPDWRGTLAFLLPYPGLLWVDLEAMVGPIAGNGKSGDELICGQRRSALRPVSVRS